MTLNDRGSVDVEDGIDFVAIWKILWAYKWLVIAVTGVFTAATIVIALISTPIYRAEVVVSDAQDGGMSGTSSLMGQLGGLASLAGVTVGAAGVGQEAHAVLKSRRLIEEFITRHDLLSELLPHAAERATLWFGAKHFKDSVLSIREDKRNGTTTVSIEWIDPVIASRWANGFVDLANELVRTRALDEASRNIKYLNEQLEHTNVVELQRVIYNLIENETKSLMLASGRKEYAFKVIDPSVPPEVRIRPRRTVMVLFGCALGFVAGSLAAFGHNAFARYRRTLAQPS